MIFFLVGITLMLVMDPEVISDEFWIQKTTPILAIKLKTIAGQKSMSRRAACPLSRLAGEGWGEGGSTGCTNLILPQAAKPPPS